MDVSGWGRFPRCEAQISTPLTPTRAAHSIGEPGTLIARGMGRSYGDSSLAPRILATSALDQLQAFDPNSGVLKCLAGTTLDELIEIFLPKGWFLPVTPGTRFVTVGGAIASDVHGKNHHLHGCFSEYVDAVKLLLADGSEVDCSRDRNASLFHATCGGMGLTGMILEATLRLRPVTSAFIDQTTLKAANLDAALELFETHHSATYSVAWIDCLATGGALGRSLLMIGDHAMAGGLQSAPKPTLQVPLDMPSCLLNRYSIQAFNSLYFHRVRAQRQQLRTDYRGFFYPLDGIGQWNRMYGRNGFVQYQFVIPKAAGLQGMRDILARISASHRGSFLAVLKVFGKQNANLLSFPIEGYTLALDFKLDNGLFALLEELDHCVLDHGGRLYLAKDARMSAATFRASYPRWEEFQEVRARVGAQGKFASLQSQRLGLE